MVAVRQGELVVVAAATTTRTGRSDDDDFHVRVRDHLAFFSSSRGFDVEEFTERREAVSVRVDAVAYLDDEVTSLADSVRVVVVREEDLRLVRYGYRVELGVGHFEEIVAVVVVMMLVVVVLRWRRCSHRERFSPLRLFLVEQTRVHSRSRRSEELDDFRIGRNDGTFQEPIDLRRFSMRIFVPNGARTQRMPRFPVILGVQRLSLIHI